MPAEPLGLSPEKTRNLIAGNLISPLEWETLSGAFLLDVLRASGIAIRTQDFYDIRRTKLGLTAHEIDVTNLDQDKRVPRKWISETDWALTGNFLYQTRVFGVDPETGEQVSKFVSISSVYEMTKNEVELEVLDKTMGQAEFYGIEVSGAQLFHVYSVRDVWDRL